MGTYLFSALQIYHEATEHTRGGWETIALYYHWKDYALSGWVYENAQNVSRPDMPKRTPAAPIDQWPEYTRKAYLEALHEDWPVESEDGDGCQVSTEMPHIIKDKWDGEEEQLRIPAKALHAAAVELTKTQVKFRILWWRH